MIDALAKALGQLGDPAIRRLVFRSIALAFAAFLGAAILGWFLIDRLVAWESWGTGIVEALGFLAVLVLAWFTFPAIAAAFAALFSEPVILAVEARHYPGRPEPRAISFGESLLSGLKLAGLALIGNLLALPFLVFPPLYAAIAYGLNGYLLGREYFEMAALRRLAPAEAKACFRAAKGRIFMAGIVIAFFSTLPFVNLIAPILGIAFMVHIFESVVNRKGGETPSPMPAITPR